MSEGGPQVGGGECSRDNYAHLTFFAGSVLPTTFCNEPSFVSISGPSRFPTCIYELTKDGFTPGEFGHGLGHISHPFDL